MKLPEYKEEKNRDKKVVYEVEDYKIDKSLMGKYKNKKYFLRTYGCQMNEHDSENLEAILEQIGFVKCNDYNDADLILLNTCSIRENAHNKAFGMLGRIKHLKETKKDLIVGICGCMAQERVVVDKILDKYKWINFVIGTHNIYMLPDILDKSISRKSLQVEVLDDDLSLIEKVPVKREKSYKAYVNIIYGCDKFCTYCIVPYTRGSQKSRRKESILDEIKQLKNEGCKEVTLLGQNVNAYGKDLYDDYGLDKLLKDVSNTGISRIRFVTSHPWDFTDEMIKVIGECENIMPSIHLPVQSGSNKILKLMGRRYTKEKYLELFDKIKKNIKNVTVSTDIIVGFPMEDDNDFRETLDLVNYCKFDNAFTFIFSKRVGTPACKLEDKVDLKTKEERLSILNETVNKYFSENNKALLGKVLKVLVEGESLKKQGLFYGYTDTNKLINFTGDNVLVGDIVLVKVTSAKTWSLDGELYE